MQTRIVVIALTLVLAASGCQTSGGVPDDGLTLTGLSPAAASAIAGDLSARLAEQAPPTDTVIQLTQDRAAFGVALEAALKGWGYRVNPDLPAKKAVKLDYAIGQSEGGILASVAMPSVVLSRTYLASAAGAAPEGPLSVLRRD